MLTVHKCSDTWLFRHLNYPSFCNLYFQKQIAYEAHILFQGSPNFMKIVEMKKKIGQIFLNFEMIALEFVALNTRFY